MPYTFEELNDKEFEILSADILSAFFKCRVERFKPGKDGGVDGRFFSSDEGEIIIQCKHFLKSGYKKMITKLKNEEVEKVNKLNPEKYVFVTSLPLSRKNKQEIRKLFSGYIKNDNDIFGQEDLNDILSENPLIEEKHFKLWIKSTNTLSRLMNNAIKGRSKFELERFADKSIKYIQTDSHRKAKQILFKKRVIIISGEPGIGKTTLAENLCLYYASKNYEFVNIEESLSEAEQVFTKNKKQIYYFDDFLGSNYFEAINDRKDSRIVKFIERIINDKSKIFILTSRTNIFNSGLMHSSYLANGKIKKNEYMLTVKNLMKIDKAKILYNHIWFSDLKEEHIDEIYKGKRYRKIIEHKNFNPRIIEFITDFDKIKNLSPSEYWKYMSNTLDNPKDIWEDSFKNQSNSHIRNLVLLVVFNGGEIGEDELRESYNYLNKLENLKSSSHTEKDFESMIRLANRFFLNRDKYSNQVTYSLFNPSIADYILYRYSLEKEKLIGIFKSLESIDSLKSLMSLKDEKMISSNNFREIKEAIFNDAFLRKKNINYLIFVSDQFFEKKYKSNKVLDLLKDIETEQLQVGEYSKMLNLVVKYADKLEIADYYFLVGSVYNKNLDMYELFDLACCIDYLGVEDEEDVVLEFKRHLLHYLENDLDDRKGEIDLSEFVGYSMDEHGGVEINSEDSLIEAELYDMVHSNMKDFSFYFIEDLKIDIQNDIVNTVDINQLAEDYVNMLMESDDDHYDDSYMPNNDNSNQVVDDLFDRV